MKKNITLIFTVSTLFLTGCCTSYHTSNCRCKCQNNDILTPTRIHMAGGWSSSEAAAPDSVEGQLRAQGKHWVKITGEITTGAHVQDILVGRLNQPKARGAIGKVTSINTENNGMPVAMVDFGRDYIVGIYLSELSLVGIIRE